MREYIQLNNFLTVKGLVNSGGEAKTAIRDGEVKVNGIVETRVKNKLYPGFIIEYKDERFEITEDFLRE